MRKRLTWIILLTVLIIGVGAFIPITSQLGLAFWWEGWFPGTVVAGQTITANSSLTPAPTPGTVVAEQSAVTQISATAIPGSDAALMQLSSPTRLPAPAPTAIGFRAIVVPLQAELKSAPQPDAASVAQVKDGKVLDLVGRTEPPTWVQVVYPPDSTGRVWLPVTQLRMYNNVSQLPVIAAAVPVTATIPVSASMASVALPAIDANAEPTTTLTALNELTAQITVATLNVRVGPGTNYAVLSKLHLDERVQIVGRNAQADWLQVVYDEVRDLRGWVATSYIEAHGDVNRAPVVPAPAPRPQATPTPETSLSGQLAILTKSGGDLYLSNVDGSNLRYITSGALDPAFSPDGAQLAYARWSGGGLPEGIYVRDLTAGTEDYLVGAHLPRSPDWSPDGQALVFSFQQGGQENYVELDLRSGPVELPPDPDWHLGYVDTQTGTYQDVPALLQSQNPSWAPDGVRIIYDGDRGLELTALTGVSQALSQDWRQGNPVWSPTSEWIVFEVSVQDHVDLYVMREDGSGLRALTPPDPLLDRAVNNVSPTWSPDGQWLAFLTDRSGQWEVYAMRPDGSEQHPLFPGGLPEVNIQHQSAGERLLSWAP